MSTCGTVVSVEGAGQVIEEEIARSGIIPLSRFMELALYHPEHGYYRRRDPFGRSGDFYTAEQLQPVFGELLAAYVEKLRATEARECGFSVLEIGAGRGDMRTSLSRWNYVGFDWSGDMLPSSTGGLILANEFFDALPVDLIIRTRREWRELGVAVKDGRFVLKDRGLAEAALQEYAQRYGAAIPEGGRLEVSLHPADWLHKLSQIQEWGNLLVIDYGYSVRDLTRFSQGTIMSYHRHLAHDDFLDVPGHQDITAHVNFSYLKDVAAMSGYKIMTDCSLRDWVCSVWSEEELGMRWRAGDRRWRLQWKQIFVGMGETFHVLEFRKEGTK